jgi:hypothetical protein
MPNPKTKSSDDCDRTWLVAHDFSSCTDAAADLALDDLLATRHGGRIVLVHVYTPVLVAHAAQDAQERT